MIDWTPEYVRDFPNTVCEEGAWAEARIKNLESKLAKAISAFEQIEAGVVPETDPDTGIWIECNMSEDEMQDIARTTLAELKEQNDA